MRGGGPRRFRMRLGPVVMLCLVLTPAASGLLAGEERKVGAVPASERKRLRLDRFYQKHADVDGLPVLGSKRVSDHALLEAAYVIEQMLRTRPDVMRALVRNKVRCAVMAYDELTTDVPEHKTLEPGRFWDRRARGLGASPSRPCVSCAEENLLGFPGDPYATENILVHEFAHAIDLMGLRSVDSEFERKLQSAYDAAMKAGLWKGLYAADNKEEYWAEGVQSWFHTNRPPDAIHNHVDTRAELRVYDPRLARLLGETFGANDWLYVRPSKRKEKAHLSGFDVTKAPRFTWPPALQAWYRRYEEEKRTGAGRIELSPLARTGGPPRSPKSLLETRILFMNRTDRRLRIYWLGYDGDLKPYGEVPPRRNAERSTLAKHVWVLKDEQGTEVARFAAGSKPGRAVVR